jgi:molybdenum cofactor synthesis domain-containing protein
VTTTASNAPRAAILLVGNELLTGKIRDENAWFLAGFLRRRGIALVEIAVVRDDVEVIAAALTRLWALAPILFTSGGVGPTHDDVTLAGVARAVARPLRRHPQMEAILRGHYGERSIETALRMAELPEGTELRAAHGWPVMRVPMPAHAGWGEHPGSEGRIYVLPGIPALLRAKVEGLGELPNELPSTAGWRLETLTTDLDESQFAPHLDAIVTAFPRVEIGSYPRWDSGPDGRAQMRVKITFEAPEDAADEVPQARRAFAERLGPTHVLPDEGR